MSPCPDLLVWISGMSVGLAASLASLWYSIHDRASLRMALALRGADLLRRQLGAGLVVRMRRTADHLVFAEIMRSTALLLFLGVGITALLRPDRSCAFNPLTWVLIAAGLLVSANSVHTLYTRRGNGVADDLAEDASESMTVAAVAAHDAKDAAERTEAKVDAIGETVDGIDNKVTDLAHKEDPDATS